MVFSFAVAILVAARSISKRTAFQIFVGTTSLPHHLRTTFNSGLHSAFYSCMAFLVAGRGAVGGEVPSPTAEPRARPSSEARPADVEVG